MTLLANLPVEQPLQDNGLLLLSEVCGDWGEKTRDVYVRPSAISHFTAHEFWRAEGPRPRGSIVHMLNGETLQVTERPESIAACLR